MKTEELIRQVAEDAQSRGFPAVLREVPKMNGTKLGLSLEPAKGNLARTYYEEHFRQMEAEGFGVTDMTNRFLEGSMEMPDIGEVGRLVDRDFILHRAQLCVCKTDWNQPFLAGTPSHPIEGTDLSAYARIRVGEDATAVPRYEQLEAAGITGEELLEAAEANSRPTYNVESLDAVLSRVLGAPLPMGNSGMYVITNDSGVYGAAAITDPEVLNTARECIGAEEVYVLGSSIHEILVVSADIAPESEVNHMISEINRAEVKPEDRLSDHAYRYDGAKLTEVRTQDRELVTGRSR